MVYLMGYDLTDRTWQDYSTIGDKLEKAGAARLLASNWLISTDWSSERLREWLKGIVGLRDGDRIVVCAVDKKDWSTWNAYQEGVKILKG